MRLSIMLNEKQAQLLAGKFMDLGNGALGSLVVAQFLTEETFSPQAFLLGILAFLTLYAVGNFLMVGGA